MTSKPTTLEFTFDAADSAYDASADDAGLDAQVEAAFGPVRASSGGARGGGGTSAEPVATIPALQREFRANPRQVVQDNIPPYQAAADIERWDTGGQIDAIIAHHDHVQRREALVRAQPVFQFVEDVRGALMESDAGKLADLVSADSGQFSIAQTAGLAGLQTAGVAVAAAAPAGVRPPPAVPGVDVGLFALDPLPAGGDAARDLVYSKRVSDVLNTTAVTGVTHLHPMLRGAVSGALQLLATMDASFAGRALDDFVGVAFARELFAHLVAYTMLLTKNVRYDKWFPVRLPALLQATREAKCVQILTQLVYRDGEGFVLATPYEIAVNTQRLRQNLRVAARRGK